MNVKHAVWAMCLLAMVVVGAVSAPAQQAQWAINSIESVEFPGKTFKVCQHNHCFPGATNIRIGPTPNCVTFDYFGSYRVVCGSFYIEPTKE